MAEDRPLASPAGMGLVADPAYSPQPRPRRPEHGPMGAIIAALFGSRLNVAISIACMALAAWALPHALRWVVLDAVWMGDSAACRAAPGGACWAFVHDKLRFMLFGLYP